MAQVYVEAYHQQIEEALYEDNAFLADGSNWDQYTTAAKLQIPIAGGNGSVYKNPALNTPLAPRLRVDDKNEVLINCYVTEPENVSNWDDIRLSYDRRSSVLRSSAMNLGELWGNEVIYTIAPDTPTANGANPLLLTTGDVNASGLLDPRKEDLLLMHDAFDTKKYPKNGRTIVMNSKMFWAMIVNDPDMAYWVTFMLQNPQADFSVNVAGWRIHVRGNTPAYALVSGVWKKVAQDFDNDMSNTPTYDTNNRMSAIAYVKGFSWGRGIYTFGEQVEQRQVTYGGDLVNFKMYAAASTVSNRAMGVLLYGS